MEQQLHRSTQSSSAGARGAVVSLEHIEQLCWSMWSSGSLGADTVAPLEHMEQRYPRVQRAAMLEHVEQRLSGSRYSGSTGANGAAASVEH